MSRGRHSNARKGAFIGAGAGILVGIVGGLRWRRSTGLLGGAGGAVVGAAVGFAIPTWRLRFP